MKPLLIWAVGVVAAFGALTGVTAATRETEQVLVVVDTSLQMEDLVRRVPGELDRIDDREYAEFALATAGRLSEVVHGYQSELKLGPVQTFGACNFDDVGTFPAASTADEKILITTSTTECSLDDLDGWTIIEL